VGYLKRDASSTHTLSYSGNSGNITAHPVLDNNQAQYSRLLYLGGVVGHQDIAGSYAYSINFVFNTGNLTVLAALEAYVGGVVGRAMQGVDNSYNLGTITYDSTYNPVNSRTSNSVSVGGVVGYLGAQGFVGTSYNTAGVTVTRSTNYTSTSGNQFHFNIGGLVGYGSDGVGISRSYNSGVITGSILYNNNKHYFYIGGLVDWYENHNSFVGGIVGYATYTDFNNVYVNNTITLSGDATGYSIAYMRYGKLGGYINESSGSTISSSYFNEQNYNYLGEYGPVSVAFRGHSFEAAGNTTNRRKTVAQLQTQSTYVGWNFTTRWYHIDGSGTTPTLRGLPTSININAGPTAEPTVLLTSLPLVIQFAPGVALSTPTGIGTIVYV